MASNDIEYIIRVKDEATKVLKGMKGAAVAAGAALATIGVAAKSAADFEKAMREVGTLTPDVRENFRGLSDEVLDLSSKMGIDAVEASKSLYQAISAGVPSDNAISFLEVASQAAIGGVTSLETAVDGITSVINAYGKDMSEAAKVSDVMFEAVKAGKTNFEQLSSSIFNIAPMAAAVGVSFEEVSAGIAVMTAQGVPTSVATTQMRAGLQGLLKPTEELTALAQEFGHENMQAMIASDGMTQSLYALIEATGGEVGAMQKLLGSSEAVQAALALTKNDTADVTNLMNTMANATGSTEEAFKFMAEGTAFQFAQMQESLKNVMILIGDAVLPIINELVQAMLPMVQSFAAWAKENPKIVKGLVIATAAVAALTLAITAILPIVISVAGAIAAGTAGMIAAIVAAAAAIGVVIVGIVANFESLKYFFTTLWENLVELFTNSGAFLQELFANMIANLIIAGQILIDNIIAGITGMWSFVKEAFATGKGLVVEGWQSMLDTMVQVLDSPLEAIRSAFSTVFNWIRDTLQGLMNFVGGTIDRVKSLVGFGSRRRQSGGYVNEGLTIVGEAGPELVSLPRGSFVNNAQKTSSMLRGGGGVNVSINVQGSLIGMSQRDLATMVGEQVMRQISPILSQR